ncbi:MAG: hypothetical protein M0037_05400 [Betaproteobacteria bacterium]|nr:hypothetical protein [Betaproteobacteria bacterium]
MAHLVADISSHGFGHLAQVAPVLNALAARLPDLRLTLCTALPEAVLRARVDAPYEQVRSATDFGMCMANALEVRVDDSAAAYAAFHADWEAKVEAQARRLEHHAPDLVLADVSYLCLAGAHLAGIPAVAMCSLNWAEIYRHYCGGRPEAARILGQMSHAYESAAHFLRLKPGMPMAHLPGGIDIGPIAQVGRNRRAEIDARLDLDAEVRLVLVSLGGIGMRLPWDNWPAGARTRYLVDAPAGMARGPTASFRDLGMPFVDVLASCDAFVTKPGYGSFVEAAVNRVPVLYLPRRDWPEEPYLVEWLATHGRCAPLCRAELEAGRLDQALGRLGAAAPGDAVQPIGIAAAADLFAALLAGPPAKERARQPGVVF